MSWLLSYLKCGVVSNLDEARFVKGSSALSREGYDESNNDVDE